MKKILLLMWVLLLGISIQAQTTTKEGNTITFSGYSAGDLATALADLAETDLSDVTKIVFSNCTLNADDFTALNSTTTEALSGVTTVDLSASTVESISTMKDMNLANMEYLRLPSSFNNAPDMKALRSASNNAKLKMVMSTDESDDQRKKVRMYSFEKNNVVAASTALGVNLKQMKMVDMAGYYGENDLYNNGSSANFGEGEAAPAAWDFTGANFAPCTIASVQFETPYYNYDDPFQTGATKSGYTNYETNSFYYFSNNSHYTNGVASIKLPDLDMTVLPSHCLKYLGAKNKDNYILIHPELSQEEINQLFTITNENNQTVQLAYAPIEEVVIPNCYTDIDYECAIRSHIQNLVIGSGVKRVHGGAFINSEEMENLDFAKGISNCSLGDQAFNQCSSMKHIALAEGVVSIGASCFWNSQHLESIRLPESLIYIGNDAFRNCLALGSITIPANVEKIGMRAFMLTALRNVYLTTKDPDKVPVIFTAGTSWGDGRATFGLNEMEGYKTIPWNDTNPYSAGLHTMTWDEAVEWYYLNVNCMAILHYPQELADKVRAKISTTYGATSSDGYGLPVKAGRGSGDDNDPENDAKKRATGSAPSLNYPSVNLGSDGQQGGIWTNDGWIQFLLMKEFTTGEESKVYTKNYKDVWYTMCFPFELTDEQLAVAFNEGFNIADFSGVQIKDPAVPEDEVDKKTLVLHFNKVAETLYKDSKKNLYERKRDGSGNVIREKDGADSQHMFDYNVYIRNGQEYHHVIVVEGEAAITKTKTFAPGNSLSDAAKHKDRAIVIDGYLASAGHPYMIHPNTGTVPTADPVPCHFSGITWVESTDESKTTDQVREELYEAEKRTVDLGVANTSNNYDQKAYDGYAGQTYTFKGNFREYKEGIDLSGKPKEPVRPTKPVAPAEPRQVTQPTTMEDPHITLLNPEQDAQLYSLLTDGKNQHERGPWYEETLITTTLNDGSTQSNMFNQKYYIISSMMEDLGLNLNSNPTTEGYNYCKNVFNYYAYQKYLIKVEEYNQYLEDLEAYNSYNPEAAQAKYESDMAAYETALEQYPQLLAAWEQSNAEYKVLIPQYAYFLGTAKNATYPKYWREIAPDNEPRTTGIWSQYAAVIIPNTAALKGLEKELGNTSTTSQAKSHPIAFDEEYFVLEDIPHGIATLIEKIEKEEGKAPEVEYMDIVVSIDGKIVSRDKTTFEGLPKGVYIINGKKYYVK